MNKIISFFNTYTPVVPLYKDLCKESHLNKQLKLNFYSLSSDFRGSLLEKNLGKNSLNNIWSPKIFRKKKIILSIYYFFIGFFYLFKKSDLNVFLTQPPFFYLVGSYISNLKKTPYIIHVMDVYPDIIFKKKSNNFFYRIFYQILNYLALKSYRASKKVIVIGHCMHNVLLEKGVPNEKISLLTNWASIKTKTKNSNILKKKFKVMYSGNIGYAHDVETIIKSFPKLSNFKNLNFTFVGEGRSKKMIEHASSCYDNNFITLSDFKEDRKLSQSLSSANIHLISLKEGYEGLLVPSKVYNILACGRPVIFIGNKNSEIARLINDFDCGIIINNGDSEYFTNIIQDLSENSSKLLKMSNNALKASRSISMEVLPKKYLRILTE